MSTTARGSTHPGPRHLFPTCTTSCLGAVVGRSGDPNVTRVRVTPSTRVAPDRRVSNVGTIETDDANLCAITSTVSTPASVTTPPVTIWSCPIKRLYTTSNESLMSSERDRLAVAMNLVAVVEKPQAALWDALITGTPPSFSNCTHTPAWW